MDILRYQRLRYRELTSYDKMMRHKNTGTINKILYVQRGHTPACVSICAAKITDVLSCFIAFLHIMQSPYAQTNYRSLPLLPPPPSSPPPPPTYTHTNTSRQTTSKWKHYQAESLTVVKKTFYLCCVNVCKGWKIQAFTALSTVRSGRQ